MPGGDGMGPMGMGPMTGRGAGYCAGNARAGFANGMPGGFRGRGCGFGRGRGFGRGFGFGWNGSADEKTVLTEQATALENALTSIRQRLGELDQSK